MDLKKRGLFILFFLIGGFIFGVITFFTSISLFLPIFSSLYIVFLFLIAKEYSKKKMIILLILVIVYLLIMIIPFPKCESHWGYFGSSDPSSQECTCIGVEKGNIQTITENEGSQCVGIPIDYVCYRTDPGTGVKEEIPCD